jgi:hypothetical protein
MNSVVTESDLVIPALQALEQAGSVGLTTAELQPILRGALKPMGQDLIQLEGRSDDRFSQKVRNLRSHERLERENLATFDGKRYHITAAGRDYARHYIGVDKSLIAQGFGEESKKSALSAAKQLKFVEEGQEQSVTQSVRRRSRRLRSYAVAYYSNADGTINCAGCCFEATRVYGYELSGLIEIHHTKPIALAGNTVKPLREAVRDVVPLCPNCHRVVHAKAGQLLAVTELKALVQAKSLNR